MASLRRACDFCVRQKRACHGADQANCEACEKRGIPCTFSSRRKSGPPLKGVHIFCPVHDAPPPPPGKRGRKPICRCVVDGAPLGAISRPAVPQQTRRLAAPLKKRAAALSDSSESSEEEEEDAWSDHSSGDEEEEDGREDEPTTAPASPREPQQSDGDYFSDVSASGESSRAVKRRRVVPTEPVKGAMVAAAPFAAVPPCSANGVTTSSLIGGTAPVAAPASAPLDGFAGLLGDLSFRWPLLPVEAPSTTRRWPGGDPFRPLMRERSLLNAAESIGDAAFELENFDWL